MLAYHGPRIYEAKVSLSFPFATAKFVLTSLLFSDLLDLCSFSMELSLSVTIPLLGLFNLWNEKRGLLLFSSFSTIKICVIFVVVAWLAWNL